MNDREMLSDDALDAVIGGVGHPKQKTKFVSAFFCEYCGETIRLNGVYSEDRAKKLHNAKFHPQIRD
ncbi:MAG: hypothetical protein IJT29_05390 [Oscillospiraceae bacterium]|nr:hypothetical protein [Oscillospiraceae bacterium]